MDQLDDINSILNAVNEINLKKKKKNAVEIINSIPVINHNLSISPDIDKLIQEAEGFKNKSLFKTHLIDSTQNKSNLTNKENYHKTLESIKAQMIEDLYSKFTKKVKKNNLKIIFNLHIKIKDLEKKLENFKNEKIQPINVNKLISNLSNKKNFNLSNKNVPRDGVDRSLKIQDSTIFLMNEKIRNFKNTEEKLLHQIIELEQDKKILLQKVEKFNYLKDYIIYTKKNLKSIYFQVEKQKKIFIDLKNYSMKIEQDSNLYKKNYEKLVIENNNIKNRLVIYKDQIVAHESKQLDLSLSINQLNKTLSKSNTITNISSSKPSSEENVLKKKKDWNYLLNPI